MRLRFRIVDVFTDRPFAGNQLCVVPESPPLATELMQALAQEIGFSETTFVTACSPDRYSMRIFTPAVELPFAGHPTLGTAFVLAHERRIGERATQEVAAGEIPVEVDVERGQATMRQLPPTFGPELSDRRAVAAAIGLTESDLHRELPPQIVSTGFPFLVVPLASDGAVMRARADPARIGEILDGTGSDGCYLFHVDRSTAHARLFGADAVGIAEDAATGAAAGPLGAYLADRAANVPGSLVISQGAEIGRPSRLLVHVERAGDAWQVRVSGGVVSIGEGWFDLPE